MAHKNPPQITTHRQYNSNGKRFEISDRNPHQIEHEDVSEVLNVRNLHPSRSASFFEFGSHKERNHAVKANRRRSMQNIIRNPDRTESAGKTRDVGGLVERPNKWIRGPLRFLAPYAEIEETQDRYDLKDSNRSSHETCHDAEIEQIGATGFDGLDTSDKNRVIPAVAKKVVSRRSVSFSLHPVHDRQTAPDAVLKPLVPSKSLPQLDMQAQRQPVTNDNGSPLLHHVKARHERRNSSSSFTHLKVPDALPCPRRNVASSNYSSYNDSLASSRRSSLMKLQSLSERLDCIKNDPQNKNGPSAWSSALDIPRVSCSQFITTEIDNARRRTLEAETLYANVTTVRAPETTIGKPRSPSPQRGLDDLQTEPLYENEIRPNRSFRRKKRYALKLESSERRSSNLDASDELYPSSRRHGYGYDSVTPLNEDASSVWGKAFQDHAERRSSYSKARLGSVSPARSGQSLERRVEGGSTRLTRPRLRRGIAYSPGDLWKEHLRPKYRINLDRLNRIDASKPGTRVVLKSSSPGPPASWSRFPSHNRAERSFSPAGKEDKVTARDFASESETLEAPKGEREREAVQKKKGRSTTYGESVMSTLNRLYSINFRRLNRGHRSSISLGGKLEYPELEILPQLSPPVQPLNEMSKRNMSMVLEALHSNSSRQSILQDPDPDNETIISAGIWSKMYEDCVHSPADIDGSLVTDTSSVLSSAQGASYSTMEQLNDHLSPRSSAEMRTSTLDFQKSLQDNKAKAQKRALQAAEDAWGKSFRSCQKGEFQGGDNQSPKDAMTAASK